MDGRRAWEAGFGADLLAPPPSRVRKGQWARSSCVHRCSERVYGSIKRHIAKIHYNSLPPPFTSWNRQPQQLRRRLIPRRRIQSSGASTRNFRTAHVVPLAGIAAAPAFASMTSCAKIAGNVAAPGTASMTSTVHIAGNVAAPASASMTSGAICARNVAAPAYASMERDAADARSVAVLAYASTKSGTTDAPIVRTSRAPWKDVHCSATVSAQPKLC